MIERNGTAVAAMLAEARGHREEQSTVEPLLVTAERAAALCEVSERTWRGWDSSAKVPSPVRIGSTVRWRLEELRRWATAGCPPRAEWKVLEA